MILHERWRFPSVMLLAVGLLLGTADVALAAGSTRADCQDGQPVTASTPLTWSGATIGTLTHYHSAECDSDWAGVVVSQEFRDQGYGWSTSAWIATRTDTPPGGWGWAHASNDADLTSDPAQIGGRCARAGGGLIIYPSPSTPQEHGTSIGHADSPTTTAWTCGTD